MVEHRTPAPADAAPVCVRATVVDQSPMARDTFRLRLRCPEVAERILPGQFFMVRAPGTADPLLGRPFALFDVFEEDGRPAGVEFGYLVVGKLTRLMPSWKPGDPVEVWGPLGNGFPVPEGGHLLCVAGGIGQTPFLAVAREALGLRRYGRPARAVKQPAEKVTLLYGVRSADRLAGVTDFERVGVEVHVATEDGSAGFRGLVSQLLTERLQQGERPDRIYCCGPEPMMAAASEIARQANLPCWVSLETPMACGIGACFSCVARIRTDQGDWDYRRVCVDGPVFPADRVLF